MKPFTIFLLALSVSLGARLPARAQTTPPADWAVACATNGQPYSLVVDAQGNSYVAGYFSGSITLGSTTLTATQPAPGNSYARDAFLAKLNAQGQYQWAMQLGDGQDGSLYVGAVDNADNLCVIGNFRSYSLQLGAGGPTLYNSSNKSEGFVARFSALNGQCQWARRFGGTGDDYAGAPVLNAAGEIFLVGSIGDGAADFGAYTLPAAPVYGSSRPFLAKLSPAGTWLWAQQVGTYPPNSYESAYVGRPVLDGVGNIYLTGTFQIPTMTMGSTTLTTTTTLNGGADLFIAKYTEGGALRWARQASPGGQNGFSGQAGFYDGQGHLYFSGSFDSQTARFGSLTLTNAGPLVPPPIGPAPPTPNTTRYFSDGFVARYDTAGTWQWAVRRGGYNTADGAAILNGAGLLYGVYYSEYGTPVQVAPLNLATGAWGSDNTLPTSAILTSDQLGRLYVYGAFTGTSLTLGGQIVPGAGGTSKTGYVARLGQLALPTRSAQASATEGLHAWPTPGPGTGVWVQGAQAGQAVEVLDVLGRRVGGGTMPTSGILRLSWAGAVLAPGVYVVHSGERSTRWVVE